MSVDADGDFQAPIGRALLYRNGANTIGVADVWLHQWTYATTAFTTEGEAGYAVALQSGVLRWMRVKHGTIATADLLTYTVVVNSAPTPLSVSLNAISNGPAFNFVGEVAVVQGDLISVMVSGATGSRSVRVGVEFLLEY